MEYRKKPVVIEAKQITEEACWAYWERGQLFFDRFGFSGDYHPGDRKIYKAYTSIETLEGTMRAELGDWIIKGVKGEYYPCKPDIFEATYEPANKPPTRTWTSALPTEEGWYWWRQAPEMVAIPKHVIWAPLYRELWAGADNSIAEQGGEWCPMDSPPQE